MHSLDDIQDRFNWSYMQGRKRVIWLQENFSSEVTGGKNRKYQVTDNGFTVLDRIHQLEQQGLDLKSAFDQVKSEMSKEGIKDSSKEEKQEEENEAKVSGKPDKVNLKYLKLLEERVEELKEDKARLQKKVDEYENKLLPSGKEEQKGHLTRLLDWLF